VAFADRILLNKCDLADENALAEVTNAVRAINANADIIRCQYGQVEPNKLININAFALEKVLEMDPEFLNTDGEHQHDATVSSVSVRFEGELNHQQLRMWISELQTNHGKDLFRYKGVLAVKGMPNKFVFQGVHMLFNGQFDERFRWKQQEVRECRLVFIGRKLDREFLEKGVMNCRVSPLRFKVGDVVEANCDGWCRGCVINLWDEGNPYRVRLDDGEECWAPTDNDQFIRKDTSGQGPAWQASKHQPWWGKGGGKQWQAKRWN